MKLLLFLLLVTITFCYDNPICKDPERLTAKCIDEKVRPHLIGVYYKTPIYECTKSECKYPSKKFEECRKKEAEVDKLKTNLVLRFCRRKPVIIDPIENEANKQYYKAYEKFKNELKKFNSE